MADKTYKEVLQFQLQTLGGEGLVELYAQLERLGKGSGEAAERAQAMQAELGKLLGVAGNIAGFTRLKATLSETGTKLDAARAEAARLREEFDAAEQPTKKLQRAVERADAAVERLTTQQNRQQAAFARTSQALSAAGVDTNKLASEYAQLQDRIGEFSTRAGSAGTPPPTSPAASARAPRTVRTARRWRSSATTTRRTPWPRRRDRPAHRTR